jgi:hypothetical protein
MQSKTVKTCRIEMSTPVSRLHDDCTAFAVPPPTWPAHLTATEEETILDTDCGRWDILVLFFLGTMSSILHVCGARLTTMYPSSQLFAWKRNEHEGVVHFATNRFCSDFESLCGLIDQRSSSYKWSRAPSWLHRSPAFFKHLVPNNNAALTMR